MLNVITLFSGYDSQALALNRLGLPYDLAAWCEIDRHAITAHNALFPQWKDRNLGDVSQVDWAEWHASHPQHIDLLTYSSPCQDFSSAGLQRGGEEGSGTRSGLLWETERAVRELRPRHLVFENVGGLVSDKFIDLFNRWQARLNTYGYTNFQQLMNAKDYGVPQNRLRIFMVSILDCQRAYYFPKPFPLDRRLKDVLEQNVEERYYLKEEQVAKLVSSIDKPIDDGKQEMLGWTRSSNGKGEPTYHPVKVANCVTAAKHENTQNYIVEPQPLLIPQATKEGYAVVPEGGVFDASYPDSTTRRGRVQEGGTVSPTIMASQNELLRYEGTAQVMQIGNLIDDTDRDFMPYAKLHALFRDAKETSVNETSINVLYPHVCRWWKALVYAAKNSDVHTRLNYTVRQKRTDIEQQLQKLMEQIQPS